MAIDPVATDSAAHAQGVVPATTAAPLLSPRVSFGELFAKAAGGPAPVSAATAAEVLRLKMLNSALSFGENDKPRAEAAGMQGLLDRFLEQLPCPQAGGAAPPDASSAATFTPVPLSMESIIDKASRRYGVDSSLIKAVIKAESDFNPRAVSSSGAQGLMQLMPATARGLGVRDPFDPEQNVMAGTRFLKDLLQRYGEVDEALAAYNWGPGNVDRHGTDSLPRETRAYLGKVRAYYNHYVA
jgi:soluble lytic murein transglycosylase-like protein